MGTVYTIKSGYVTDGSTAVPVSMFNMSLAHNGVPKIKIEIDPVHNGTGSPEGGDGSDARVAAFYQAYARYNAIFDQIELREGASISFTFTIAGTDGSSDTLTLANWVVLDVGIGGFSFGSAFKILLTIGHPAAKLNNGGMYLPARSTDSSKIVPIQGDNVLDTAVRNLKEKIKFGIASSTSKDVKTLINRTSELVSLLPAYLKWSSIGGQGMPVLDSELAAYVGHAMLSSLSNLRQVSPWEFVSRELVNRWFLSIRPTYWKPHLEIGPNNPWAEPLITIEDTNIASITSPSSGDRLSGIINSSLVPALAGTTSMQFSDGVSAEYSRSQAVIEDIAGPVLPVNIPAYLSDVVSAAMKNRNSSLPDALRKSYTTNTPIPELDAFASGLAGQIENAMVKVCKQVFCNYYRQSSSILIKTKLMLSAPGGIDGEHIVPGFTCNITSNGTPVIKFLVTAVDHVVNCNSSEAYTVIAGAYTSPVGKPNLNTIAGGVVENNYVYS